MNTLTSTALPLYASLMSSTTKPSTPTLSSLSLLASPYISHLSPSDLVTRLFASLVHPRLFSNALSLVMPSLRTSASSHSSSSSSSSSHSSHFATKLLKSNGLEHIVLDGSDLYGPLLSTLSLAISVILLHQTGTEVSSSSSASLAIYGTVFSSLMIWIVVSWSFYYFGCIVWLQRRRMQWHEVLCLVGYQLFAVFVLNGVLGFICGVFLGTLLGSSLAELVWFSCAVLLSASTTWSVGSVLMAESDEMVLLPGAGGSSMDTGAQSHMDEAKRRQGGLIALGLVAVMQVTLVLWLRYAVSFVV